MTQRESPMRLFARGKNGVRFGRRPPTGFTCPMQVFAVRTAPPTASLWPINGGSENAERSNAADLTGLF